MLAAALQRDVLQRGRQESLTADVPRELRFDAQGRFLFCGTDKGAWVFEWTKVLGSSGNPAPLYHFRLTRPMNGPLDVLSVVHLASGVFDLAHDPQTDTLLLGCSDGKVCQINLATGSEQILLTLPEGNPIYRVALSADGVLLCTVERGQMNEIQKSLAAMFAGTPEGTTDPDDRPDRLLIWDYQKLLARV